MNAADLPSTCSGLPSADRCDAELPDNPQCAPNYHFGMLLGVEDFEAEQGFHVGRLRRHQRTLHGTGVVAGYAIDYDAETFELRVGPGYGIDALGRDVILADDQCVNLALWWAAHRQDEVFDDIEPGVTAFDLDIVACYATCLDRAVPAIAEPCAGDASDIAYSRICETATLSLRRHDDTADPPVGSHHLLRVWLGLEAPARDPEGQLLPEDQWLNDALSAVQALPADEQASARASLARDVMARAVAATAVQPADDGDADHCLVLARLGKVLMSADGEQWSVSIDTVDMGARECLLPTQLLQALLTTTPRPEPPVAGPVLVADGLSLAGDTLTLVFDQALAAASVAAEAFSISEFDTTTGWQPFTPGTVGYDDTDPSAPTVSIALDRVPTGARVRLTVIGTGSSPLLGANLIPAGAALAAGDGRNLTTTLIL